LHFYLLIQIVRMADTKSRPMRHDLSVSYALPKAARLRAIATVGDQSYRMAKAIAWIKANYTKPLCVENLRTNLPKPYTGSLSLVNRLKPLHLQRNALSMAFAKLRGENGSPQLY